MPSLRGDLGRALWENRANLDYAWRVLRRGACDACALSSNGLADWSHPGLHRCPERLARLRQATQPALDLRALADVGHLAALAPDELQRLGRLPCPLLRRAGEPGPRGLWPERWWVAPEHQRR